jgi:hypothetical protein
LPTNPFGWLQNKRQTHHLASSSTPSGIAAIPWQPRGSTSALRRYRPGISGHCLRFAYPITNRQPPRSVAKGAMFYQHILFTATDTPSSH